MLGDLILIIRWLVLKIDRLYGLLFIREDSEETVKGVSLGLLRYG